jgi:hypothetical protein
MKPFIQEITVHLILQTAKKSSADFPAPLSLISPRRCPYFEVVVGLVWSHDPESYAGGSVCYW